MAMTRVRLSTWLMTALLLASLALATQDLHSEPGSSDEEEVEGQGQSNNDPSQDDEAQNQANPPPPPAPQESDDGASGRIGAKFWRVRALTKVPLEGWVLSKFQLFTSQKGDGQPVPVSSANAISKSFKGMSDANPPPEFKTMNAFDGNDKTSWQSEDGEPGQWIGAKFDTPVDIQSIIMRTPDMVMGPSAVMVEKSDDGESWARVAELSDMRDWGTNDQLYKLVPMDRLPPSVFSLRSQSNPALCVGVKPRVEFPDQEDSPLIDIEEGAVLELQHCMDDTVTQWWSFDVNRGLLHNAKDTVYIAGVSEGSVVAGAPLAIKKCTNGCPDEKASEFMYSDSVNGGFVRSNSKGNLVLGPKDDNVSAGTQMVFSTCGSNPQAAASLKECQSFTQGQFELLPMFELEPQKEAIKCAPYSHSLADASPAETRQEAQRLCAADLKCSAYSWVDSSGETVQNKVFLCSQLHDVQGGVTGWELGIRAGRAYDSPYGLATYQTIETEVQQAA